MDLIHDHNILYMNAQNDEVVRGAIAKHIYPWVDDMHFSNNSLA